MILDRGEHRGRETGALKGVHCVSWACSGITWMTKEGLKRANYWGSLTQAATLRVGNYRGEELYTPFSSLVPLVNPNDLVLGGWDISGLNLAEAMERAQVYHPHPMSVRNMCPAVYRLRDVSLRRHSL